MLGEQVGVATLPIVAGQTPVEIAKRALRTPRRLGGYDVVILDTAGRAAHRRALMLEMREIKAAIRAARNPARRRRADRPGRGQHRAAPSTSASASPASC